MSLSFSVSVEDKQMPKHDFSFNHDVGAGPCNYIGDSENNCHCTISCHSGLELENICTTWLFQGPIWCNNLGLSLSLSLKKKKKTQILQNLVLGFELFCCAVLLKKLFCLHCRETPSGVGLRVARWWLNPNQSLLGLKTKLKWKKTKTKGLQSERPWNVRGSWNKLKKLLGLRCFSLFWILFCFHHLNVKLFLLLIHAHKYLLGTCIYARAYLCGRCIMCV